MTKRGKERAVLATNPYTNCSHGKSYKHECAECEAVWLKSVTIPEIITRSRRAAHFAYAHPGLMERDVAMSLASLNHVVADLAEHVVRLAKRNGAGR